MFLDAGFREVVPDLDGVVVAGATHVEEASYGEMKYVGYIWSVSPKPKLLADSQQNSPSIAERDDVWTQGG